MRNKIPSLKELVIIRPICGMILAYVFMRYFSARNPSVAMLSGAIIVVYLDTLRRLKNHGYLKSHPDPKVIRKLKNLCPACDGDGYFIDTSGPGLYHEETCLSCKGSGKKEKASIRNRAA